MSRITLPRTRAGARDTLSREGVTGRAAEALLDATAPARHESRVRRFIEGALAEYGRVGGVGAPTEAAAYGLGVLVLEAFGVCDERGPNESNRKVHHRAFRSGCGPRIGLAAGPYEAACRTAFEELWRRAQACHVGRPSKVVLRPASDRPVLVIEAPPVRTELPIEPGSYDSQSPNWIMTIALEAMRRACGEPAWFPVGAERAPRPGETRPTMHVLDLVSFAGDISAWAEIVNAAAERARVDRMAEKIIGARRAYEISSRHFSIPEFDRANNRRISILEIEGWGRAVLAGQAPDTFADAAMTAIRLGTPGEAADAIFGALRKIEGTLLRAEQQAEHEMTNAALPLLRSIPQAHAAAVLLVLLARVPGAEGATLSPVTRAIGQLLTKYGSFQLAPRVDGFSVGHVVGLPCQDHAVIRVEPSRDGEPVEAFADLAQTISTSLEIWDRSLCGVRLNGSQADWIAATAALRGQEGHLVLVPLAGA